MCFIFPNEKNIYRGATSVSMAQNTKGRGKKKAIRYFFKWFLFHDYI